MSIKTQMLTLLLAFSSTVIFAQTPSQQPAPAPTATASLSEKHDAKNLVHSVRNERKEKAARRTDIKDGNDKGTIKTTKEIRKDKRHIHRDAKDLKKDGVKHPVHRAVHHIERH